ncbi:MAG: diguanylate cyclase [Desulfovibrio sp.]|nr:MAG: diguanylate cyclase [Desulfovibrio sp.]
MDRILIVEDSKMVALGLSRWIQRELGLFCDVAASFAEAQVIAKKRKGDFLAVLIDLVLPDAPHGEAVEYCLGLNVPVLVVTGSYEDETRRRFMAKGVADYVVKRRLEEMGHLLRILKRLQKNREVTVLVADDSRQARTFYRRILTTHRINVLEAENGRQALDIIQSGQDVRLVVTDYHMPELDGFGLVAGIRKEYPEDAIAVIALSSDDAPEVAPRFLKLGANDFLAKPCSAEEFLWRVTMNLDLLELMDTMRDRATRDPLTGLFNRRHFFESGSRLLEEHKGSPHVAAAMLDIDHFKGVNDTYGHHAGDLVIRDLATTMDRMLSPYGIIARFGGEEFCALLTQETDSGLLRTFEELREKLANRTVTVEGMRINYTVSIGVTATAQGSIEDMLNTADSLLYAAKANGRNRVEADLARPEAPEAP